jgi:aminomethyltransferase
VKGDKLVAGGKEVGYVASTIHSPTLNANIALAYVRREHNKIGTELMVKTATGELPAKVVELPFFSA